MAHKHVDLEARLQPMQWPTQKMLPGNWLIVYRPKLFYCKNFKLTVRMICTMAIETVPRGIKAVSSSPFPIRGCRIRISSSTTWLTEASLTEKSKPPYNLFNIKFQRFRYCSLKCVEEPKLLTGLLGLLARLTIFPTNMYQSPRPR